MQITAKSNALAQRSCFKTLSTHDAVIMQQEAHLHPTL